jgi:hypothetical protein
MKNEISAGAYAAFAAAWRGLTEAKKHEWLKVLKGDKLTACDKLLIYGAIKKQPTKKVSPQNRLKALKKLQIARPELFSPQLQSELNVLIDTLKPKDTFKPFR